MSLLLICDRTKSKKKYQLFRIQVVFCTGPSGFLHQELCAVVKLPKNTLFIQDKCSPLREDKVRENALIVVC